MHTKFVPISRFYDMIVERVENNAVVHGRSYLLFSPGPTIPEQQYYRQAPSHYVSHLLGHEGTGSAFALLKSLGWATGLVAGEASTSFSQRYGI